MRRSMLRGYGGSSEDAMLPPRAESVSKGLRPENDPMISDFYKPEEIAEMRRHREWTESLGGRRRTRTDAETRTAKSLELVAATERLREEKNVLGAGERSRRRRRPDPPHSAYGETLEDVHDKTKDDVVFKGGRAAPLTEEEALEVLPVDDFVGTPERKKKPKRESTKDSHIKESVQAEASNTEASKVVDVPASSKVEDKAPTPKRRKTGLSPISPEEASKQLGGSPLVTNLEGVNPRARATGR